MFILIPPIGGPTAAAARAGSTAAGSGSSFIPEFISNPYNSGSFIQNLHGGNALFSLLGGLISGTLSNPLSLLSIGTMGASFFLGATQPWLILVAAAVNGVQTLDSAKGTFDLFSEEGLGLSTLLSAGGTVLSAYCVMPGVGNFGQALAMARMEGCTLAAVERTVLTDTAQLPQALTAARQASQKGLQTVEKAIASGEKALEGVETSILNIAKAEGIVGKEAKDVIDSTRAALQKKLTEAADETAKNAAQKNLDNFNKLVEERNRLQQELIRIRDIKTKLEAQLKRLDEIETKMGTDPSGAMADFNKEPLFSEAFVFNRDRAAEAFIRETYGQQGLDGYRQAKNWKNGTATPGAAAPPQPVAAAAPPQPVAAAAPPQPVAAPRAPMTAPDTVINGTPCRFNSVTGKFEPITITTTPLSANETAAAARLEAAMNGGTVQSLTAAEIRQRAIARVTQERGPRPPQPTHSTPRQERIAMNRARQEWDDAALKEINGLTIANTPPVVPPPVPKPVTQVSPPIDPARQRAIDQVTDIFGYRPTDPATRQRWDDLVQAAMNGNLPSKANIRLRVRAIVEDRLGPRPPATHAGSSAADRARELAWRNAYEEELRRIPRLPLLSPFEHYRGSQVIRNYPRALAELPPVTA